MDAPTPPDPVATAKAQAQMNKDTAITQYGLNATDINAPTGTVSYKQIGTWPDGTPHYQQDIARSPEDQKLADQMYAAYGKMGDAGNTLLDQIRAKLGMPFSIDASRGKLVSDIQKQFLDPQWNAKSEQLESQLQNKGIMPGSEAYNNAKRQFEDEKARAYDQMFLDSYSKATGDALLEHNTPLNDLNSLIRGPQPAPTSTAPTPGVAPVDYTGLVENNFKNQMAAYSAELGAIGTAAGTAAGGWASGFKPSDRTLKRDVQLIGFDSRGWGIYLFSYIFDPRRHLRWGFMADEVAIVRPDAVAVMPNGYLAVDYGAL
jgi:hypothetical protein